VKKTLRIGWQKYEDVIESQLNSPIVDQLYEAIMKKQSQYHDIDLEELENEGITPEDLDQLVEDNSPAMMSIDDNLAREISLATNFDCWIGHTNFNITLDIKNILDTIEGVELLKVFSRYRFLVGVGRMFDFADVRKRIEELCKT